MPNKKRPIKPRNSLESWLKRISLHREAFAPLSGAPLVPTILPPRAAIVSMDLSYRLRPAPKALEREEMTTLNAP